MNKSTLFGDNGVEFLKAEVIVSLSSIHNVSIVHHFCNLIIVQGFS